MGSMADARTPRIRLPKVRFPGRSGTSKAPPAKKGDTETETETETETKPNGTKAGPAEQEGASKPAEKAEAGKATPKADAGAKAPDPNLMERMEGLQGWMAEIERKQARTTYFGGLALLLALGAAGAALYFGLTTHSDSATKNDLDALTNRVNSLQGAVKKNSKDTQSALNASIAQLQQSIANLQKKQAQAAANISTLQSQVASGALNKKAAPGVTPAAPGAATTTTTPNTGKNP
jgi:uncharacterized protein HemX